LDERTDYRFVIGAAIRTHVSRLIAIEPEFLYIRHDARRSDYLLQANLVREFGDTERLRPYLVGGIGILHSREKFPGAQQRFSSSSGLTVGGGAGVRMRAGDRLAVSPEVRIGFEPLFRATVTIGGSMRR
jgi:hypothetical protein